jgi:hypothetical protein
VTNKPGGQRVLFLTTLIDLLIQVVFIFMIAYYGLSITLAGLQHEVNSLENSTGRTLPEIAENWRKLVAAELAGKDEDSERRRLRKEVAVLEAENAKLRGKGGLDQPPCWRTDSNQPEYIFRILLLEDGFLISKAWPDERKSEVAALGIKEEELNKRFTTLEFKRTFAHLRPRQGGPSCQHFVLVYDKSITKLAYTAQMAAIEHVFYKNVRSRN